MFKDEAEICYRAGKGGDGLASFRREKYLPKGGPNGGDGGNGGNIILKTSPHESSLYPYTRVREYFAKNGRPGQSNNKTGKSAQPLYLYVPVGTILRDPDTDEILCDLVEDGQEYVLAKGGRGGRGNQHFATPTNQTPYHYEEGEPGEEGIVKMELKLIADVGIIGLPNAGKSTLLSVITKAKPKTGAYPFTTLNPQLGFAELDNHERILFADIPGLIEGSHSGVGLGDQFLRHIERTRLLLHLVDVSFMNVTDPGESYRIIRKELGEFSSELLEKKEVVVATKLDLNPDPEAIQKLEEAVGQPVLQISSVSQKNLKTLLVHLYPLLEELKAEEQKRLAAEKAAEKAKEEAEAANALENQGS